MNLKKISIFLLGLIPLYLIFNYIYINKLNNIHNLVIVIFLFYVSLYYLTRGSVGIFIFLFFSFFFVKISSGISIPIYFFIYSVIFLKIFKKNSIKGYWKKLVNIEIDKNLILFNKKTISIKREIIDLKLKDSYPDLYNIFSYKKRFYGKSKNIVTYSKKQNIISDKDYIYIPINLEPDSMTTFFHYKFSFLLILNKENGDLYKIYPTTPDFISFITFVIISDMIILPFFNGNEILYLIYLIIVFGLTLYLKIKRKEEDWRPFLDIVFDCINEKVYEEPDEEFAYFPQYYEFINMNKDKHVND